MDLNSRVWTLKPGARQKWRDEAEVMPLQALQVEAVVSARFPRSEPPSSLPLAGSNIPVAIPREATHPSFPHPLGHHPSP